MGFIKQLQNSVLDPSIQATTSRLKDAIGKVTGADVAADISARSAQDQADAIRQSSERAAKAAQESAAQTARQQEQAAARSAAQAAAADLLNKPMQNADVQLGGVNQDSVSATQRKRRQTFGIGSSSGVNI